MIEPVVQIVCVVQLQLLRLVADGCLRHRIDHQVSPVKRFQPGSLMTVLAKGLCMACLASLFHSTKFRRFPVSPEEIRSSVILRQQRHEIRVTQLARAGRLSIIVAAVASFHVWGSQRGELLVRTNRNVTCLTINVRVSCVRENQLRLRRDNCLDILWICVAVPALLVELLLMTCSAGLVRSSQMIR
jgi:hypothetical protein